MDAILALPPPIPPIDGGDGGALLTYALLRQWASTRGALAEALRRRLARGTAILAGLDAGRHPSAGELAAGSFAEGAVQLAFPELVISDGHTVTAGDGLAACVEKHAASVRALLDDLDRSPDPDIQRARHITALRSRHAGAKMVIFTQYADSVNAMFRLLRSEPGVAALTADGGRVAGGSLTRAEALARFAPRAQGVAPAGRAQCIDVLLTTDLLSEGVNLQDASIVVHLDLPWTPARLEQRVGRVARIGSTHDLVHVYAMLPPASSERIVRVEQRLREKLRSAARTVGVIGTIVPSFARPDVSLALPSFTPTDELVPPASPARSSEDILTILAEWRPAVPSASHRLPLSVASSIVATVEAPLNGFLALLGDLARPRLVADIGAGPTDDPSVVLIALRAAGGPETVRDESTEARAVASVARWRATTRVQRDLSVDGALQARARRSVVDRIAAITRRAPRHLRPTITTLAATARQTAITRYGAGAERVLGELAVASMPDEAWLRAVSAFGALHGAVPRGPAESEHPLLALIVLRDVASARAET